MGTSSILFFGELAVCGIFWIVQKYVDDWVAQMQHAKTGAIGQPKPAPQRPTHEADLQEIPESFDPAFRQTVKLRTELAQLSESPEEFVQHSRVSRKLIEAEKHWDRIFAGMPPEEQQPYIEFQAKSAQPSTGAAGHPAANASGSGRSMFAQVMDPALSGQARQDLYASLLQQMAGGGITGGGDQAASSPARTTKKFLPMIKFLIQWIVAHAIAGWAPRIRDMAIFAIPAGFMDPILRPYGSVWFPFSIFAGPVSGDVAMREILNLEAKSAMSFAVAPQECRQFLTFGFVFATFLMGTAIQHTAREMVGPQGCLAKAWRDVAAYRDRKLKKQ